jgi:hypothetical protein
VLAGISIFRPLQILGMNKLGTDNPKKNPSSSHQYPLTRLKVVIEVLTPYFTLLPQFREADVAMSIVSHASFSRFKTFLTFDQIIDGNTYRFIEYGTFESHSPMTWAFAGEEAPKGGEEAPKGGGYYAIGAEDSRKMVMHKIDPNGDKETVNINIPGNIVGALWEVYIKEEHYSLVAVSKRPSG